MQAIYGLHVHVAVSDEERAIQAVAALSRYIPLFIALSANSRSGSQRIPVRFGAHEGLGLMPRSDPPPPFAPGKTSSATSKPRWAAGSIPDYTLCWWDVRPTRGWARSSSARPTCRQSHTAPPLWPPCPVHGCYRRRASAGGPAVHRREQVACDPLRPRSPAPRLRPDTTPPPGREHLIS